MKPSTPKHPATGDPETEWVLLHTTHDDMERSLIQNLLEDHSIPTLLKDQGSGGYMRICMGFSIFGTRIYVPSGELEKAVSLLEQFEWNPWNNEGLELIVSGYICEDYIMRLHDRIIRFYIHFTLLPIADLKSVV